MPSFSSIIILIFLTTVSDDTPLSTMILPVIVFTKSSLTGNFVPSAIDHWNRDGGDIFAGVISN